MRDNMDAGSFEIVGQQATSARLEPDHVADRQTDATDASPGSTDHR